MVFILSALWWIRIRGLCKFPDGRDWLWGELGLALMGGAMLSKPLIQFSVDGRGCVPSLLLTWGQTMVVMEIMVTPFKSSQSCTATLSASDPAAGHRQPTPLSETLGHSQAGLGLWGHCTFLLGPGAHKVLFMLSKSLFPQSRVSSVIKSHWPPKSNSLC